jgi:hypothetical protein
MKTVRDFKPADRYVYDFGLCSWKNGFAQIDTSQDAHYFGTWASPDRLLIVCYCEGDINIKTADNKEEFIAELRALKAWNEENGYSFGIDPGDDEALAAKFCGMGLSDLLH